MSHEKIDAWLLEQGGAPLDAEQKRALDALNESSLLAALWLPPWGGIYEATIGRA